MLIDANVFNGYFQSEIGRAHVLQGCPSALISTLSTDNPVHHDPDGIIEHEWRNLVDRDWFDAWLAANLQSGIVQYQKGEKDNSIESKIRSKGFPTGRDIIYVRVGISLAKKHGACDFFTEDLDFYDPTMKGGSAASRIKLLKASAGPVAKILGKGGLSVLCVP